MIMIETMMKDFNTVVSLPTSEEQMIRTNWHPPCRDCIKINVDATVYSTSKIASLGVARNVEAEVCFSIMSKSEDIDTPIQAEIKAIIFGIQMAKDMNIRKIQVESNCLMAVKEISKRQDSFCEWSSILLDILELSADFELCF